jgi:hypothetical protein
MSLVFKPRNWGDNMQIEVFSLCDAATAGGGKLNVLGAFDTIWAKEVPVVYPQCTVALRVRFLSSEGDKHEVSVKFIDADGKHVVPPTGGVINIKYPQGQRSSSANLILNIQGLKLEKYGEYSIDLAIGKTSWASLPLFVKKRQPQKIAGKNEK